VHNSVQYQELFDRVYSSLQKSGFDVEKNIYNFPDFKELNDTDIFKHLCRAIFTIQAVWHEYEENFETIDKLLLHYDIKMISELSEDKIKQIYDQIINLKIRGRFLNIKLHAFRDNAKTFLKIANQFGSVHNFIKQHFNDKEYLRNKFIKTQSQYKLKLVGISICSEFFKNIGIDDFKADKHIIRFFSRIGLIDNPKVKITDKIAFQVRKVGFEFAAKIEKPAHYVDNVLWFFCADDKGEICSSKPKCQKCELYTKEPQLCKGDF